MLAIEGVSAGYNGLAVVQDLSLEVAANEVFAIVGSNGAGKTTTLRCISGLVRPQQGRILFGGEDITRATPQSIVQRGLVHVPEGRELFAELTVRENLMLGSILRPAAERRRTLEEIYAIFPRLHERDSQAAGTLSGGEQQMVAIGRALMAKPRLLMLDEPSIGLAPKVVAAIFDLIGRIVGMGITVLLVEQNAVQALEAANRACVLESGRVALQGKGSDLLDDPAVQTAYLGL
jgi:branched-chain amino acid transport system ATP-binding protein